MNDDDLARFIAEESELDPKFRRAYARARLWDWIRSWWVTWRVWRNADDEQRAILTGPFDLEDFEEVEKL